jgi:predicted ArsR family transcriptional regulator
MRVGMVAKLSGPTQNLILETLAVHEELTAAELARLINKKHDAAHSGLISLHEAGLVYVQAYITTPGPGRESRVWALGNEPDAKRPNYKGSHLKKSRRDISRRYYLKRALKRDGVTPWSGLIPIVERKVTL